MYEDHPPCVDDQSLGVWSSRGCPGQALIVGTVHVFTRSGNNWTEAQPIPTTVVDNNDLFGASVAIDADTLCFESRSGPAAVDHAGDRYQVHTPKGPAAWLRVLGPMTIPLYCHDLNLGHGLSWRGHVASGLPSQTPRRIVTRGNLPPPIFLPRKPGMLLNAVT